MLYKDLANKISTYKIQNYIKVNNKYNFNEFNIIIAKKFEKKYLTLNLIKN